MPEIDVPPAEKIVVLALSASASDTQSLTHFLRNLPPQDSVAIIVVLQNYDALDEEAVRHGLGDIGRKLADIEDGSAVDPGRIYLCAPNLIVVLEGGRFRTRGADQIGGAGAIDSFLVSLARDEDGRSIAVALAGTDGDGTLGFKAVKEGGGLTLAEETKEARADELSFSNAPAALADAVLPIDQLIDRVVSAIRQLRAHEDVAAPEATDASLTAVAAILRNLTGHDFHGYKPGTFLRRVQRRMQVLQITEIKEYVEALRAEAEEAQQLFNDLLIGVTQFFRDPKEFDLLERDVIPKLFAGKNRDDQLRIWVIGCSTGEEAYTLGILLREYMAALDVVPQVQIFATDLDGRALASARAARFAGTIAADLSAERLARWFVKEGDTYCIVKEVREMCIFSQHSIIKDAPFSRLDLISCRNLLIYLDVELQNRIIPLFHFALKPEGVLFLGNSENVSRHAELFTSIEGRSRIFLRKETGTRILPDFPFTTPDRRALAPVSAERIRPVEGKLSRRAERFAERYASAYVIADASYNVLHFSGRTGRYIDPAGGAASLSLLQLAHPDLRIDLRAALTKARETQKTAQVSGLRLGQNGKRLIVDLVVEPVQDEPGTNSFFVLFKDGGAELESAPSQSTESPDQLQHTQRLEAELATTRERLQATIEELESTNEELKSSNEEYQSLNEELQSANEELETSKEELQSVNEELTTVNGELGHRVQELGRANSDLKNFLESTQIATIFLDNELRITSHTPAVTEIFHLIDSDAGRPISHIKSRIAYEELQDDARRVLRTLGVIEREIANSTTGAQYLVRILPYRSVDNFIAGIVLTFVNITERKRAEERQHASERRLLALVEGIPQLVWRAAYEGRWTWASPQWCAYTGLTDEQSRNRGWLDAWHPDDRSRAIEAWRNASRTGFLEIEGRLRRAVDGEFRWFQTRATPVHDERGDIIEWLGTSTDIDELRRMQEQQRILVDELQHRTRNLIGVVRSIAQQTIVSSDTMEAFSASYSDRLSALSRVQGLLSRSDEEPITIGVLIRSELDAMGASMSDRIVLEGPEVRLSKATVQTFSLALHELATNARKYGALVSEHGQLNVTWRLHEADGRGRRLVLEWLETGIAIRREKQKPVTQGGYGRELIERALPYALDATTRYELGDDEVRCLIDIPLVS